MRLTRPLANLAQPLLRYEGVWLHGKDLVILTGMRPGDIYPVLTSLCDEGWLETEKRDDGRYYRSTPAGSRGLAEAAVGGIVPG